MIKTHDDIGTQGMLDPHGFLRSEKQRIAVEMIFEVNTFVCNLADCPERKYLKAAGVCENRLLPANEVMDASCFLHDGFSRLKMKMIGVAEENLGTKFDQILMREPLHRAAGPNGHEKRSFNQTVGGVKATATA